MGWVWLSDYPNWIFDDPSLSFKSHPSHAHNAQCFWYVTKTMPKFIPISIIQRYLHQCNKISCYLRIQSLKMLTSLFFFRFPCKEKLCHISISSNIWVNLEKKKVPDANKLILNMVAIKSANYSRFMATWQVVVWSHQLS